ncbi:MULTISPECIES: phosphate ABC transporter substrate-binding protein PstS [unclassified Corynebacterium]|uniref:phosphate ABC transporter substrate-binding protein PstS n=1 Tax=unclassified Corynebacterium TaxID=2624378 RepID=UPI0026514579|nr:MULTISPECIES: phosphate ABC transporter substrate-binding protein PstS [unclassified Corynebacterium]MDN8595080.1 phosphate ABC transporter substrate-binding protein PstS [Corynebacterium sp. P4_F2]WKK56784.1 phosphate ABC transporter substrate-binding protein PstS [Corynebacterium sp. P4-C1]WKK64404.1 phosphate ABC transporter substrate-binding protein PstS [Corynebacterium sp. P8-C1]
MRNIKRTAAVAGIAALTSVTLVACGDSNDNANDQGNDTNASESQDGGKIEGLSGQTGQLVAEGATSQQNAMDYFGVRYAEAVSGANLAYNPTGSGNGIKNFIGNQVVFAGSDSPLKEDKGEVEDAKKRCGGNDAWHLPMVIGPVAIAYNLEGVDELNLTIDNVVEIFNGTIKNWNDPKIAENNKDAKLPDQNISVIYRSGESGTTENFQKFLAAASDGKWTGEGKSFPGGVGTGEDGSNGVAQAVEGINGAITYVEAGFARDHDLGVANIDFGGGAVELTDETVNKALDNVQFKSEGNDMVVDSDALFASNDEGAYPLVLTTYEIVCSKGYDEETKNMVKDFLTVVLESQDEDLADAGFIPVKGEFADKLKASVGAIS